MYVSTTITPPVVTHKWKLLYRQMMNDKIVKYSCSNNIKYFFRGDVLIVKDSTV